LNGDAVLSGGSAAIEIHSSNALSFSKKSIPILKKCHFVTEF
jgi:hypothetical protein